MKGPGETSRPEVSVPEEKKRENSGSLNNDASVERSNRVQTTSDLTCDWCGITVAKSLACHTWRCKALPQGEMDKIKRDKDKAKQFRCLFGACGLGFSTKKGLTLHQTMKGHRLQEDCKMPGSELEANSMKDMTSESNGAKTEELLCLGEAVQRGDIGLDFNHKTNIAYSVPSPSERIFIDTKTLAEYNVKPQLKLPNVNDDETWALLDQNCSEAFLSAKPGYRKHGDINKIMDYFGKVVYDVIDEQTRSGELKQSKKKKKKKKPGKGRKETLPRQLERLRIAKRDARASFRRAAPEAKVAAQKALICAVKAYATMNKLVKQSDTQVRRSVEKKRFLQDPWKYTKSVMEDSNDGKPEFSQQEASQFFTSTYSDSDRCYQYKPPPGLPKPKLPVTLFDSTLPTFKQFSRICWKKSNRSSSGFNGISFLVYKRCASVRRILWHIVCRVWVEKTIPSAWQIGRIKLLDKGKDNSQPGNMRPISILNAEGRLFWTIYQERLADYMLKNGYIDRSVQKAFLPGMAGCIEHATMVSELFKDAKQRQRSLCTIWLDLANAYGSIRHSLAYFALEWYHVPAEMIELLFHYYEGICLQVQTEEWESDWFGLEIGVPQGCTASTIIFDVAFQLVLDIHQHLMAGNGIGYTITGMTDSITAPAYADDVQLVATSPEDCQVSIDCFEQALAWTRSMKLKPSKCKTLAFRRFNKGQMSDFKAHQSRVYSSYDPRLRVYGKVCGFIGFDELPMFKYLGMWVQFDLRTDLIRQQTEDMLVELLEKIDALDLTGAMKSWIANHYICAKLSWVLLIQDFPISLAKSWDVLLKRSYRRWLRLAKPAEPGVLYRSTLNFGLNLKRLEDSLKQLQVVKWHILKTSQDAVARQLYKRRLELDTKGHIGKGRIDSPCMMIERTQRRIELDEFATSGHQFDRSGLGFKRQTSKVLTQREKILAVLKEEAEKKLVVSAYRYEMQTNWVEYALSCEKRERKDLTWKKLLSYQPNLLAWTLNAQSNTLPSPDNLRRWNQARHVTCGLCARSDVTLGHILCGCFWVNKVEMNLPRESRFKWRHDCILAVVVKAVRSIVVEVNAKKPYVRQAKRTGQQFVPEGHKVRTQSKRQPYRRESTIDHARDWEVLCDLRWERKAGTEFAFPHEVALTAMKPDLVVWSRSTKTCIVWELTAPLEENIARRHADKLAKYLKELTDNVNDGWELKIVCGEVGAKGWIPPSYVKDLRRTFGFSKAQVSRLADDSAYVARQCSYVIWLNRDNRNFEPALVAPPQ